MNCSTQFGALVRARGESDWASDIRCSQGFKVSEAVERLERLEQVFGPWTALLTFAASDFQ